MIIDFGKKMKLDVFNKSEDIYIYYVFFFHFIEIFSLIFHFIFVIFLIF